VGTLALAAFALVSAVSVVGAAWVAARERRHFLPVQPAALEGGLVVIIPARNEAARIGETLDALLREPAPKLRVYVYDDRSDDGTLALVRERATAEPRLTVFDGSEDPPPERFGKPAALGRALARAEAHGGDIAGPVLFLDADVVLEEGALGGLRRALEASGAAALSGAPRLRLQSAVEALFVPAFVSLVGARHRPSRVHDDARSEAFLNGQLILVERGALEGAGGFAAVADAVLEDVALAGRLKASGARLRLADLRGVAATRMYTSWREVRQGFGKNVVPLLGGPLPTALTALFGVVVAFGPVAGIVGFFVGSGDLGALCALAAGVTMAAQSTVRGWMQVPRWPVLVLPLVYLGVAAVLLDAARRTWTGGDISWRGRTYRASRR
jgi:hypothetical protein